jgi:hypothetical protein
MPSRLPKPWDAFLGDLDAALDEPVELHCLGGFVVSVLYGLLRPTADVDVLVVKPLAALPKLISLAGEGSPLHKKHKVYLERVTVATYPERYDERLREMFPDAFQWLRLYALDPYDLALSKLERHYEHDREDVLLLAEKVPLDTDKLRALYEREMRPYLGDLPQERADRTMNLWVEAIKERRSKRADSTPS